MKHKVCILALAGMMGLVAAQQQGQQQQDIVEVASANQNFSTLVTALKAADLVDTLKGEGPFTVFAPTNEAFAALPQGTLDRLLQEENKQTLAAILKHHVVSSKVQAADLKSGDLESVQGKNLKVEKEGDQVRIGEAKVTQADLPAKNGVIHAIDKVIIPEGVTLPRDT